MTDLEGSHSGGDIGTFRAAFEVKKFLSIKPSHIYMQIFLLVHTGVLIKP